MQLLLCYLFQMVQCAIRVIIEFLFYLIQLVESGVSTGAEEKKKDD